MPPRYDDGQAVPRFLSRSHSIIALLIHLSVNGLSKKLIKARMIPLTPKFNKLASEYIRTNVKQIVKLWNKQDYNSFYHSLRDEAKHLMRQVVRIGSLTSSLDAAFRLFHEAFRYMNLAFMDSQSVTYDEGLRFFDEPLLRLCIKLTAEQDIGAMQSRRAELVLRPLKAFRDEDSQYCRPFLLRSMQFMTESIQRQLLETIVNRVLEDRSVPKEIADIIRKFALDAHGIPAEHDPNTWVPFKEAPEYRSGNESQNCACLKGQVLWRMAPVFFWSTSKRRYVQFHEIDTKATKLGSWRMEDGGRPDKDNRIFVQCGKQFEQLRKVNTVFTWDNPYLYYNQREIFEVDACVGRGWKDFESASDNGNYEREDVDVSTDDGSSDDEDASTDEEE